MTFKPGDVVIHKASEQRAVIVDRDSLSDIDIEHLKKNDLYAISTGFSSVNEGCMAVILFPSYTLELAKS